MPTRYRRVLQGTIVAALSFAFFVSAFAFRAERRASRFDKLVIPDPSASLDAATQRVDELPIDDPVRAGWDGFVAEHGSRWSVRLDRRSGAPMLVEGQGIPWIAGSGNTLAGGEVPTLQSLERSLRTFTGRYRSLLLADDAELVLNREGSGQLTPETWQIVFDRKIGGIPVAGERYIFVVGHGNLISFGAPRWSNLRTSLVPLLDESEGLARLEAYMKLEPGTRREVLRGGDLLYLPQRAPGGDGAYRGPVGAGYATTLVRAYALRVEGEPGTWVGYVDARDGSIVALFDDNKYAQVKGGVYPISDDGICLDGCEQLNYPMPYADITGGSPQTASSMGKFNCTPGTATTTLAGPYIKVADVCGPVSQSVTCNADIDLSFSAGTDCTVPSGTSAGDTHSARTSFYHLNRIAEHARAWLPSNTWLTQQLVDNLNIDDVCNAFWDGTSVNFFKSGGGCNNTGEIAGVFLHEWGHGLDGNDGGDYDNPGEAYADITALLFTHVSCLGRGFFQTGNCDGDGNACLNCTGVREMDWDQRANHTPSTPAGFVTTYCFSDSSGYNGPCGREQHCEGYLGGETMWDLAVRDLPASGLDLAMSWQLTDRLWYKSRTGSGGNAYTCSLPSSDGCAVNSWFSKLRAIDDDDGNLANGTPHAAAIFAAFNRHAIACGAALDASNQNTSSCPAIGGTTLTAAARSSSASLSWTAVANASSYAVLRSDAGCSAGSTIVATVTAPTTYFTDTGLINGYPAFYRVQPIGANSSCQGPVSGCQTVSPLAFAGSIKLDASVYNCASLVTVTVTDENIGGPTTTAKVVSGLEPAGETITLTETPAGSGNYTGTILLTSAAPAADGKLSVAHGTTITARYVDANDGQGGLNVIQQTTAAVDCGNPSVLCNGAGGNWSSIASWSGGNVPEVNDTVLIGNGCTITLDTNATIKSLTVGQGSSGVLQFESTTARTLTVNGSVTIAAGATIQSAATGTVTTHLLSVGADLIVNGTLDLSTNADTAGAELRFAGAANNTFSGSGPTVDLRRMSLAKGAIGNTLEITRGFTVRGAAANDTNGFMSPSTYTGTLKISGTATYASNLMNSPSGYTIPATGGIWLNNPNFTVNAQGNSVTMAGLLRVSAGTYNVGTSIDHSMNLSSGANVTIEGGALNVAGRFGVNVATSTVRYTQSGGTVTVCTAGNASTTLASFDLGTSLLSNFFISGGSIIVRLANTGGSGPRDYRVAPGGGSITGGTLQFGDASSGAAKTFTITGLSTSQYTYFPNLVINNASAGHIVQVGTGPVFGLSATTTTGTTLNLAGLFFLVAGNVTNNGTINGTTTGSRLWFNNGDGVETFSGSGTVTAPLAELRIENPAGVTLTHTNQISTSRVSLVLGALTNSNKITLGNAGSTSGTTQFGETGSAGAGGSYDVAPTFNAGTGGIRAEYRKESGPRTTGLEIPGSRSVAGVTINNPNGVTLAGGGLTITSFLTLTSGLFTTSDTNTPTLTTAITSPPAGSSASYVDGPLAIQLNTATNTSRTFGIGGPWAWRPVVLGAFHSNATLQTYTAQVITGPTAGTPAAPLVYLNPVQYVRVQNTANIFSTTTATVQLSYGLADPVGTTSTARVAQSPVAPGGIYTSRGGTTTSSPTTGIVSTTAIAAGNEFFVIGNESTPPSPPANDTCAAAVALSLDTPVAGTTLNARDDYRLTGSTCFTSQGQLANTASTAAGRDVVYSFTAPASGKYSFRITKSTGGDPVLYTASSCPSSTFPTPAAVGTCLSAANRRTSSAEEVVCQTMASGQTVYAIVDEIPSAGAPFEIEVTSCDQEISPNGLPTLANTLTCGKEGSVANNTDRDFYSLGSLGSGSRVFAMIDAIAANLDDTRLNLTDTTNTREFDDSDGDIGFGASGLQSVIAGGVAASGQNYLKVSGTGTVEPYRLYAVVQPPLASATSETEPNDTAGTANSASNRYFKGTLSSALDADFYSFPASAGDLVFLGMDCDSNRDGSAVDGVLTLIASDGSTVLATANGSGTAETPTPNPGIGLDATTPAFAGEGLVYRIRSVGTYYSKVSGTPGGVPAAQDYALSISIGCTVPAQGANLSVSQIASTNPVSGGANVTYTVTVTNNGPSVASSVNLTDTIPANLTFVSSSAPGGWSCGAPSGGQVACSTASMAASSSANLLFTYSANICTGNLSTTHASAVSSATFDPVTANNTSSIQTSISDTGAQNNALGNTVRLTYASGTTTVSWTGELNPPFNVYRGLETSGSPWSYNQTCFASGLAGTSTTDTATLSGGQLHYYLVSRDRPACPESSLGLDSNLLEIPNLNACP